MLTESVLGHVSEAKNAVFLPAARAPHFTYVGDSVLGHAVNLGAGVKLSNLPIVAADAVKLTVDGKVINTGLRKFGAILGDKVQIGCNAVLNPGTVMGPNSMIYPERDCGQRDLPGCDDDQGPAGTGDHRGHPAGITTAA